MDKTIPITKINVDRDKSFYIKVLWKPNDGDLFQIKIYDGNTTWSGRFSYEFASKYRDRFDETDEQYNESVKKGLSKDPEFSYSFVLQSDDAKTATFSWKKKFEEGLVYLVHGSVPVHREEIETSQDHLLDLLIAENHDLRDSIDALTTKNNELSDDLGKCRNDLDKFIDIKTTLETSLYGKFVQLLSAKKRRIELLEENLSKVSKLNNNKIGDEVD